MSSGSLTTPAWSGVRIYRELINADILENTVDRPKSEHTRSKYMMIPDYPDNFLENYEVSFFYFDFCVRDNGFYRALISDE